jgi:CelD/BcsL family acetyltransferase involved in cellulose biosynthesis
MRKDRIVVREYNSFCDLKPLKERWNQLALQGEVGNIFLTYEWCKAFSETILAAKQKNAVCVLVAFLGSRVVGIAPLALWKREGILRPFNELKFIGDPRSDYSDFLIEKEAEGIIPAFMGYLKSASRQVKWDELYLSQIPEDSNTIQILSQYAEEQGFPCKVEDSSVCLSLIICKDKNSREQLMSSIRRKKTIRQAEAKLSRLGNLVHKRLVSLDDMNEWLEYVFAQHMDRWVNKTGTSIFMGEENINFYRTLVQDIGNQGWLRFSLLLLDNEAIATHFGFLYGGVYYYYKPTFDQSYREYSPGNILLTRLIEDCIHENVQKFDFGRGDETYKRRFTNHSMRNRNFILYRNTLTKICALVGSAAMRTQSQLSSVKRRR